MNESKAPEWLVKASKRIIEHMNDDHCNSIVSTLNAQHVIKDKGARMNKLKAVEQIISGTFSYTDFVG